MKKALKRLCGELAHFMLMQLATMLVRDLYVELKNIKKEPIGFKTK